MVKNRMKLAGRDSVVQADDAVQDNVHMPAVDEVEHVVVTLTPTKSKTKGTTVSDH